MRYVPGAGDLRQELAKVRQFTEQPTFTAVYLDVLNAAPAVLVDGMVVRADGTNWDPGSGAGLYWYDATGTTWRFLG